MSTLTQIHLLMDLEDELFLAGYTDELFLTGYLN